MVALIQHNISSVLGIYLLSFEVSQIWTFCALFAKLWSVCQVTFLHCQVRTSVMSWCNVLTQVIIPGAVWEAAHFHYVTDWSRLSFWCRKTDAFSFHRKIQNSLVKVLCKSAHLSCLDSAAHHTCAFPPLLLETNYESRPNPVPFKCVGTDFSGSWICLPTQAGYCFEPLCLKLESFMSLILSLSQH